MAGARAGRCAVSGAIAWDHSRFEVALACADRPTLARALAAMGLFRVHAVPRSAFPAWPPEYRRADDWTFRAVLVEERDDRGRDILTYRPVHDPDARRAAAAAFNRAQRDSAVFVLRRAPLDAVRTERKALAAAAAGWWRDLAALTRAHRRCVSPLPSMAARLMAVPPTEGEEIWLDAGAIERRGVVEWRSASGGAVGDDLFSLGAFVWGCGYGRAAHRLARFVGVRLLTEADVAYGEHSLGRA